MRDSDLPVRVDIAQDDSAQAALPEAVSNGERARLATRRWMLAGMAGMATAMLCSFTGALHLLSPPLESIAVFAGGWAVFASLRPKQLMQEFEQDDSAAVALLAQRAIAVAEGDRTLALQDLIIDRADDLGRLSCALHDLAAEARANKQHARLMSRRMGHQVERDSSRSGASPQREVATDPLTGLGSRRAIQWHAQRLIASDGPKAELAIMIVDIDHYKMINDVLGDDVGNHCLRFLADILQTCLRSRDAAVRLGGGEFLAIMPGANFETAHLPMQRLLESFEQMPWTHELARPTLSIGLAGGTVGDLQEGGSLLERAEAALYAAKRNAHATPTRILDRIHAA